MNPENPNPEFSIVVDLDALPRNGRTFRIEADAAARAAIARRLDAPSVESLAGEIHLQAGPARATAKGRVRAAVIRVCVASLSEFAETVDEEFDIDFIRAAPDAPRPEDGEDLSAPEILQGRILDIGELLVQELSLAMDAFPRKPDGESLAEKYAPAQRDSPFSALSGKLKNTD